MLAVGVASALRPLAFTMQSEEGIRTVVEHLGWTLPPGPVPAALTALAEDIQQLYPLLVEVTDALNAAELAEVLTDEGAAPDVDAKAAELALNLSLLVERLHGLRGELATQLSGEYVATTRIADEFTERLFNRMFCTELERKHVLLRALLSFAGIVERSAEPAVPERFQPAFTRYRIHWNRVWRLLDPASLMQELYGWGTPRIDSVRLFDELVPLSFALCMPGELRHATTSFTRNVTPGVPSTALPAVQFWLPVYRADDSSLHVVMTVLPTARPDELQGLALVLVPSIEGNLSLPFGTDLELNVEASGQVGTGAALVLRPDRAPEVVLDIEGAGQSLSSGRVGTALVWKAPEGVPQQGVAANGGTALTAGSISVSIGAEARGSRMAVFADVSVVDGKLSVASPQEDGFLSSVLPQGLPAPFSFMLRWSQDGLHFSGAAGLATTLPMNVRVGAVRVQSMTLEIKLAQDSLTAEASLAVSFKLGPAVLTLDRIGFYADARSANGNLGGADLDLRFKPPTGVGFSVDASVFTGGGYLSFDPEKQEYSGVVELQLCDKVAVKAMGLLTTRLPDGGKGYSLVLVIFVEGFTPIQLGFGFALTGIGGLLALNRTFNEEALRAGLKNHTLDSVMFPKDPIRNAPQIISNLNRVFPPAAGHHLFGPMVKISWGTPALITAEIGVVLELGARLRLLILAQIAAILPRRDHDLVRLQMDAIGMIDFDQGTASLDASLYDSRLLKKFVLTGDMAMRLKWEGSPNFALAIGGLHPAFNPPVNFPKLERITINLSAGDNPRIRCEAYFALTANTVQFGARAELYAAASGFSIQGEIGYDVLIQLDPFFFIAEFHAQLQLKRGSTNLFKVKVEGSLAGPRPLHLKGKATFEILWWDVTIRVDTTLVKGEKPPAPAPIEVLPLLKEALRHPDSWATQLSVGQRPLVTLNTRPGEAGIRLHPLGTLQVKENVVPLNMDLSRFGQAIPAGERRFTITDVTVGDQQQVPRPVRDFFAPAQFLELTDDEKLSRPSFEPMDAGVALISDVIVFTTDTRDWLEVEAIEFETWILDKGTNVSESDDEEDGQGQKLFYRLSPLLLSRQSRFGAAANSELRRTGKARYRTGTVKHQMAREGWTIVDRAQLSEQSVTGVADRAPTYSEAVAELSKLRQETPTQASRFKVLRPSELQPV